MSAPVYSGWLHKLKPKAAKVLEMWDRRYFRLEDTKLCWFADNKSGKEKGSLALKLISDVHRFTFPKTPKPHHQHCGFKIVTRKRTYNLLAENEGEADEWVDTLTKALEYWRGTQWGVNEEEDSAGSGSESDTSIVEVPGKGGMGLSPPKSDGGGANPSPRPTSSPKPPASPKPASRQNEARVRYVSEASTGDEPRKGEDDDRGGFVVLDQSSEYQNDPAAGADVQPRSRISRLVSRGEDSDIVKIHVAHVGGSSNYTISRTATVADLLDKIRNTLSPEQRDGLSLWEVTPAGRPRVLATSESIAAFKGGRLYRVAEGLRLFIIHFDTGRFIPALLPASATPRDVCEPEPSCEFAADIAAVRKPRRLCLLDGPLNERELDHEESLQEALDTSVDGAKLVIRSDETVLDSGPAITSASMKSMLKKKGEVNQGWQDRYCVFSNGALRYYKNMRDSDSRGCVELTDMLAVGAVPDDTHRQSNVFFVTTKQGRRFLFSAETPELRGEWIAVLQSSLSSGPAIRRCGYLEKRGYHNTAWKRRWFVLRETDLLYSDTPDSTPTSIPLDRVTASNAEGLCFDLVGDRTFNLRAESKADKDDWLRSLQGREPDLPAPKTTFTRVDVDDGAAPRRLHTMAVSAPTAVPSAVVRYPSSKAPGRPANAAFSKPAVPTKTSWDDIEPVELPAPVIHPKESTSDSFGFGQVPLPEHIRMQMEAPDDALSKIFDHYPGLKPVKENSFTNLRDRVQTLDSAVRAAAPPMPSEAALARLRDLSVDNPRFGGPVEVPSPATLRMLLLQPSTSAISSAPGAPAQSIRLSGVVLHQRNGRWALAQGEAFHAALPEAADRIEVVPLPPGILALYNHSQRRWFVVPDNSARGSASSSESSNDPAAIALAKSGGRKLVARLIAAAEGIMAYHSSATQRSGHLSNADVVDDELNPAIGAMVRGDLCTALGQMLTHGLVPFRMGGLIQNTIWTVISATCPSVGPASTPAGLAAYRVVNDINKLPYMSSFPNMKFRAFIAASLNHKFLEDWLREFFNNTAVLGKYYQTSAFVRCCTPPLLEDMLLGLQPLLLLPFRLHMNFERKGRPTTDMGRTQSFAEPPPRTRPAGRMQTMDSRAHAPSGYDPRVHAPAYHEPPQQAYSHQPEDPYSQSQAPYYPQGPGQQQQQFIQQQQAPYHPESAQPYPDPYAAEAQEPAPAGLEHLEPGTIVRALYDNQSTDEEELSFVTGDMMQVEQRVSDEWLLCILYGLRGLVPAAYVARL
eukprot:m.239592 g.239592  ORF g.239592 m.239592 type:complete len:1255 (-) comp13501_c0_seq1:88-3852(-)